MGCVRLTSRSEGALSSSAVVRAFDPGHDGDPELVSGVPALAVEDVLLQEGEEALHGSVVADRADVPHRSEHAVTGESLLQLPGAPVRAVSGSSRWASQIASARCASIHSEPVTGSASQA
jgi:hypothetical protein